MSYPNDQGNNAGAIPVRVVTTVPASAMVWQPPVTVAITTASAIAVPANASRRMLLIQVNGAADVAIAPSAAGATPATIAGGILLSANVLGTTYPGGTWEESHTGAVTAIGRAASSITYSEAL